VPLAPRVRPASREPLPRSQRAAARQLLDETLARRGARERLVLSLLYHEGLTPGEVAAALHLPPGEVTRTLNRVRAELAAAREGLRRRAAVRRSKRS
jgi:DNA-directed RNA polymerase specialized sigma24 family protein